jgi:hypothetical protein
LEYVFGKINADRDNLHVDGPLNVIRLSRSPHGTLMPGAGVVDHITRRRKRCMKLGASRPLPWTSVSVTSAAARLSGRH